MNSCFKLKKQTQSCWGKQKEEDDSALMSNVVTEYNESVLVKEKSQKLHLERELKYFLEREKSNFFRKKFPSGKSQE